ncbi:MAG: RnfABCDGE type electron transport complex subunit G [Synergistaceae bacterium]|jgi:electron transport complex protein RnfG|nr:RnfABCDGE type electron transport complex subunit G [Synergistaceae bacterium]
MEASSATAGSDGARKIISLGLILFTVTAITGLILGVVYQITLGPIQLTQERLKSEALSGALPEAESFSKVELKEGANAILSDIQEGLAGGERTGYCITVTPRGYGGIIEIVVGITKTGGLRAIRILSLSETPGLGAKAPDEPFSGQFNNKDVEKLTVVKASATAPDQIQAISGATITSTAVTNGVNAALEYWGMELKGGN